MVAYWNLSGYFLNFCPLNDRHDDLNTNAGSRSYWVTLERWTSGHCSSVEAASFGVYRPSELYLS